MITKAQLRTQFTLKEIGDLFGITKGAVHQWPENGPIDKKYEYELRHHDSDEIRAIWKRFNSNSEEKSEVA